MSIEVEYNNKTLGRRSWLWKLVCPCCMGTAGCECLHCKKEDTTPNRWFEVQNGQLQSNAKTTTKKRRRRKRKKTSDKEQTNTAAIINRPVVSTTNTTESEDAVRTRGMDQERARHVSDLLKHLLHAAKDASSQSSAPPSGCDDDTPPLLRSDVHERYQPAIVMEMTSSTQTEGELEYSLGSKSC